jgi:Transcriptional regulatory protein, C terminal
MTNAGDGVLASPPHYDDVVVVRWPEQRNEAERLARLERPHLLLVEPGVDPPQLHGCLNDWIRLPTTDRDIRARRAALAARAEHHPPAPTLDAYGELSFRGRRVFLSPIDQRLATLLIRRYGHAVADAELFACVWHNEGEPARVRGHISRLRKRIQPLGLEITAIRGFGYRMDAAHTHAVAHPDDVK